MTECCLLRLIEAVPAVGRGAYISTGLLESGSITDFSEDSLEF